MSSFGMR